MKFYRILALLAAFTLSACTSQPPKPKPLLSEKQMTDLLIEMQLTEATLQQMRANMHRYDSTMLYAKAAYTAMFGKYGLDPKTFEANLYYHTYHSRNLKNIYEGVDVYMQRLDSLDKQVLLPIE